MTKRPGDEREPTVDYASPGIPADERPKRDFGKMLQIATGYVLGLFMLGVGITQLLQLRADSGVEKTVVAILVIAGSLSVLWFTPAIVRWQHHEDES